MIYFMKSTIPVLILFFTFAALSNAQINSAGFDRAENSPHRSVITVVSYLLRDRAVIVDSLVMRKCMYIAFKTGHPLSEVKRCAVAGMLSWHGTVMSRDTAWLYDEAAGNLGFNLPYLIPDGVYKLDIRIINPKNTALNMTL